MTCGAWQMRPESRGHVRIQSADYNEPPLLDPNYLAEEKDRAVLIAGLKEARGILQARPLASVVDHEIFPGSDVQTDDERSEEHTSELQSLMRISYAVFCFKKKKSHTLNN